MLSIHGTLEAIFARFTGLAKPDRKFLTELFEIIPCVRGRLNFTNLSRYSIYNEVTFRRHFAKFFDWLKFNYLIISFACFSKSKTVVAAIDCSYISKSGKKTYGIDKFWSGVAKRSKKGLEISLVSLIETDTGQAWSLDVRQTPANLSGKEGTAQDYTRVDFYLEQMTDCFIHVPEVQYYLGDGFYTKKKVLDTVTAHNKHLIGKLRPDANLKYLLDRTQNPDAHGNQKYDGKVNWKALNLDKWEYIGTDQKYPHLRLYTQILYSPQFKRKLKVVFVWNARTRGYAVLFSTDLKQDARQIVSYYQLRFKIEFIFRDAKQFTGITHCQARDEDKLDFHFNMSLAALNLYYYEQTKSNSTLSMNSFIRKAYNTKFVKMLFDKLSFEPELEAIFNINHPTVQNMINLGQISY
jgi:hypothetical protein